MSYSDYGGKPYPSWKNGDFNFPGYKNAILEFKNVKNNTIVNQGFLVSPSNMSDQRTNNAQYNKTTAGWVVYRTGKGLGTLTISGVIIDSKETPERLRFIKRFTSYAEDGYNDRFETKNDWLQSLIIEGVRYSGYIQNISFQKTAQTPYAYQYSMTFLVYSDKVEHVTNTNDSLTENAMDILSGAVASNISSKSSTTNVKRLAENLYNMLT